MAAEPIAVMSVTPRARQTWSVRFYAAASDYWALTKPEVNFLILITTFAGFYLTPATGPGGFRILLAIHTLLGTLLVASGTGTLNQYLERTFDAEMRRTARRPLASGRIESAHALWFGMSLALTGTVYLALAVNVLASLLAVVTILSYLFLYTPLKRKSPLCTLVGAFPGAVPPLIGWAAARGRLDPDAWLLYAVVFLWQFPHFMAIAWMYREDYARAGYLVLPRGELRNRFVFWQSFFVSLALIPISLIPTIAGRSSPVHSVGGFLFGLIFFAIAHALPFAGRISQCDNYLLRRSFIFPRFLF
jgi:protoheme IX farnesyltransferase